MSISTVSSGASRLGVPIPEPFSGVLLEHDSCQNCCLPPYAPGSPSKAI